MWPYAPHLINILIEIISYFIYLVLFNRVDLVQHKSLLSSTNIKSTNMQVDRVKGRKEGRKERKKELKNKRMKEWKREREKERKKEGALNIIIYCLVLTV
jgi:hypothetical protein